MPVHHYIAFIMMPRHLFRAVFLMLSTNCNKIDSDGGRTTEENSASLYSPLGLCPKGCRPVQGRPHKHKMAKSIFRKALRCDLHIHVCL